MGPFRRYRDTIIVVLLLAVPFFAVANCIGLALWRYRDRVHQVYAVDLAGAGVGAGYINDPYRTVTEDQLNGGKHVAGTGTIDPEGIVGPIGAGKRDRKSVV